MDNLKWFYFLQSYLLVVLQWIILYCPLIISEEDPWLANWFQLLEETLQYLRLKSIYFSNSSFMSSLKLFPFCAPRASKAPDLGLDGAGALVSWSGLLPSPPPLQLKRGGTQCPVSLLLPPSSRPNSTVCWRQGGWNLRDGRGWVIRPAAYERQEAEFPL